MPDRKFAIDRKAETLIQNFTFYSSPTLTLVRVPCDEPVLFPLETAASLTGVHPEMLRYYCRAGLVEATLGAWGDQPRFDEDSLGEVRRIEHYRRHLGVGLRALPLISDLRREGERLHIELRFLKGP